VSLTDLPIGIAVTNADSGDSILRTGATTTLKIALVNNSGADIAVGTLPPAATFGVYLPARFFTPAQQGVITVSASGWAGSFDPSGPVLNIDCTQDGTWADGATLTFTLGGVVTDGPPGTDSVTIVPANMDGDLPLSLEAPLAVANPPKPGNLQLPDVLQVTLDNQGSVLRSSSSADALSNTLYLTLKNAGATALATAPTRQGNPQVHVTFVYGATSGALAPDTVEPGKGPQLGSAWNITVGISSAQSPWSAANPRPDSEDPHPQWTLTPSPNNPQILGPAASDQANVTFSFGSLVSLTPIGHTQMFVLCTGFAKDAQTAYDDHLFVLDIVKLDPPPTRGLLSFFGPDPVIPVSDPNKQISIPLRWSMMDVASITLLSSSATVAPLNRAYPPPLKPLAYDTATVTVPAPQSSQAVFFTLQAFDAGHGYLNSQQFTAYAQVSYVIDGTGHVYPVALFGSTFWMLANYQFADAGSYDYADYAGNEATFGRLYTSQALTQVPEGWAVPTAADWTALLALYGDAGAAYTALSPGGRSGFSAQLGGQRQLQPDGSGLYQQQYSYGYYWAAGGLYAQFSATSGRATLSTTPPAAGSALSVRLVRHA
jgi:uncharacterized protein (TIGR02145 family)